MKNIKKNNLFEEHIRKINHHVAYKVNESPKYRSLVDDNDEFDGMPDSLYATQDGQPVPSSPGFTNEAGDQEDASIDKNIPQAPSNDQPIGLDAPTPAFDKTGGETGEIPPPPVGGNDIANIGAPVQQVDDIQNEIIKHNIEAMKSIHDQLESLNNVVQGLNSKIELLNADVEEVKEPTNAEKLMSKTNVSYPYYFNLNDVWSGNWFNEKRGESNEKGMKELPDGTFVADFDDLPQKSKTDVQNSFNDLI